MKLTTARVLLTGAAGGIGSAIARELVARGAEVLLVDMNEAALRRLVEGPLAAHAAQVDIHAGNLTRPEERTRVAEVAARWRGGVNVLVNNAGVSHFRLLDEQPAPEAQILNTGSVFGGIGYAAYAVYSATKFGIRGFTEALRRELADTTVQVHYLAPRATRTGINTAAVEQMNAELKVAMDPPPVVALAACDMLEAGTPEAVIGWPEKFFVRLNALLPRLVDGSLRKQLPVIRRYAGVRAAASDHSLQAPRTTP